MAFPLQLVIDCADPDRMCDFWSVALGYEIAGPPGDFPTWTAYWQDQGIPDDELGDGIGNERIADPDGVGPPIWFQQVPETKTVKNRLHLDITVTGGRTVPVESRKPVVRAAVARLEALGATRVRELFIEGVNHFGIVLRDPEGNEFCVR